METGLQRIHESVDDPVGLIVTDMNYPVKKGEDPDGEAGFILINKLKECGIKADVIVCSTRKYIIPDILASVWYSSLCDLNLEFKKALDKWEE